MNFPRGTYCSESREKAGKMEYEVGRNKPPVETQFQPGQSGNPKGYEKGRPHFITVLDKWLKQDHGDLTLPDGRVVRLTKEDEMIRQQLLKAIQEKDTYAAKTIFEFRYGKAINREEIDDGTGNKNFASEAEHREYNAKRLAEFEAKMAEGVELIEGADSTVEKAENILQSETTKA